jgi:hypothetical protein
MRAGFVLAAARPPADASTHRPAGNWRKPARTGTEPFQDLDRGGLAGAVRPEERDDLAGAYVEVDAVQDVYGPVPHPKVAN